MPRFIEITDFSAPELDVYARLTEAQLLSRQDSEKSLFIAESPKVISCALKAGYEPVSILAESGHLHDDYAAVIEKCGDIPVYTADTSVLNRLTGFPLTRAMLCAMRRKPLPAAHQLCAGKKRIVLLENVVNPTNIGAIFRSAAALGMDAVLLTPGCCDPLYRRACRVSMGTVFQVPWTYLDDMKTLREAGFKTAALALDVNSLSIDNPVLKNQEKLCVVLGAEGDGLTQKTVTACDYTVKIPMAGGVDSLNVAAAGAVAFWELRVR
ncbi:MAG: RNA methyltransferase [Clostridia bacterium]|nr:RNA methyltransferase [Clostridia bacterium]